MVRRISLPVFGPSARILFGALAALVLVSPVLALQVPEAPESLPGTTPQASAPDPEVATGWTLRRVAEAEETVGVPVTGTANEATEPVVEEAGPTHAALMASLLDALDTLQHQVVNPVEKTAADLQSGVEGILAPPAEPAEEDVEPQTSTTEMLSPELAATLLVAGAAVAAAGTALFLWVSGSSGTLGAGAAGMGKAGLGKAGTDLRRLLPFASPLFTRFEKETVLGHPKRETLYALIMQNPGVSLQSLCDETGLSRTAVAHHLRLLELQHLVVSKRHGRSRHYFENGGRFGREQKDGYAVLQNERSKSVADFIRAHPGAIQKDLCAALGMQASIAHWHVRRLTAALLVDALRRGRTVSYFPTAGLQQLAAPAAASAPIGTLTPSAG